MGTALWRLSGSAGLIVGTLFGPACFAATVDFDDIDASAGDVPIDSAIPYAGFNWSAFVIYTATPGFPGFNNGIVSPANAAYGGGETGGPITPIVSRITANITFDFFSADLGAGYYDGLQLTVAGERAGVVVVTQNVTIDTRGALPVVFDFRGIDAVSFTAAATAGTIDPYTCGSFNCTQFTIDNVIFAAVPEVGAAALLMTGLGLGALVVLMRRRPATCRP